MKKCELSIPLYHVDLKKHNLDFILGNNLPEVSEDAKWGGRGVYLWDNFSNAQYWKKVHWKEDAGKASIVQTFLKADPNIILDLTEPTGIRAMEAALKQISLKALEAKDNSIKSYASLIQNTKYKGSAIDLYHDYLEEMWNNTFSVLKIMGLYPKVPHTKFFNDDLVLNKKYNRNEKKSTSDYMFPHVTIQSKAIYVVRDQQILTCRQLCDEEGLV